MQFDNTPNSVYTEVEVFRIAKAAADLAVKDILTAMHLDSRITQTHTCSPRTLTVKDMAGLLGISMPKAYQLTRREGFPVLHVGKRILINQDMLTDWMRQEAYRKESM